jgi:NitT/TauT family transport system permease protein
LKRACIEVAVKGKLYQLIKGVMAAYAPSMLVFVALIAAWQLCTSVFAIPRYMLPAPTQIAQELWAERANIPHHILVTLFETLAGFTLAVILGTLSALLISYSRILQSTIYPILLLTQSVPKIAIAPILFLWLGYGMPSKVFLAFLVSFFPIVVDTTAGMNAAPPELLELVHSLSDSKLTAFTKIRFPWALPHFFAGLKVAITLSVIGAVTAEFVGSDEGLGYLILISSSYLRTGLVFGGVVLLSLMGIILFTAVSLLEKIICPWYFDR